jgi:hypothetical protein
METRSLSRAFCAALAAVSLAAVPASAQVVTYSTSGTFSGGSGTTTCTPTQCTSDGFTLSFQNAAPASYIAPTLVDMGQFITAVAPAGGTSGLVAFTGVNFVLTITQTDPTSGSSFFTDGISGSLSYNPSSSSLVWTPTVQTTTIGTVSYKLVIDNTGNINIQAPTTGAGQNPNPTSVKANITATPEPATALLLLPGLAGLGMAIRVRRRRSA